MKPSPAARRFAVAFLFALGASAAGFPVPAHAQESAAVKEATKNPGVYAVFETTKGTIVAQLEYEKTPVTVANFVGLATGEMEWKDPKTGTMVKRPFYDGLKFHRCIPGFMIQGGCPLGNGRGDPGYRFADEFHPSLKHDKAGILSMANSGPHTNGSQFFITLGATPHLDNKHSVFGHVVAGQDVATAIAAVPMKGGEGSTPVDDILMKKITIVRTGPAAQAFDWKKTWTQKDAMAAKAASAKAEADKGKLAGLYKKLGVDPAKTQKGEKGLSWIVREAGSGAKPKAGQTITAHYTGYLTDGTKFDSSVDRGQPFETAIGVGRVIKGWDMAFMDMKVGEKRVLIIPPDLGYGSRGAGNVIPPDATLVFDVELLGVK